MRPSAHGLGDSKYIARDVNILLGLFSPARFELPNYLGYDIKQFKDNIRFLEVCINRDGEMGGMCPLFFDGATTTFKELPPPGSHNEINKIYKILDNMRNKNSSSGPIFTVLNKIIKFK